MADDISTSTDTSVEDAVDTSVDSEDGTDNDDVDLEDIEVDLKDIESEPEEAEELSESEDTEEAATDDEPSEDESDEESEETELSDEDKQKQANNEMAQRRIQEREARITRVKEAQAAYVAEASQNQDPLDAAVRQLQVDAYNNTVDRNTNQVKSQYDKAVADFPILTTNDPVIQAEIDAAIDAFQAQYVTIDAYGNPAAVNGDLYATLQAKADAIEKLTGIRVSNQEKNKGKEKSKTLQTPNRAPKEPKKDPMMDAFDEEANK